MGSTGLLNDVDVSPWQYRFDMWHRLKELTDSIVDESRSSGDISLMHRDVVGVYRKIEIVENYWGKPGRDIVKRLGDCVDCGNYRDLNQISSHVLRLLSDGTHRVPGEFLDREQSAELEGAALEHQQNDQRNIGIYFEVLFVGSFSQSEERYIRDGLRRTKSHYDEFVYELVFVSSLQEALVASNGSIGTACLNTV